MKNFNHTVSKKITALFCVVSAFALGLCLIAGCSPEETETSASALSSIEVTTISTTTTYKVGETFSASGMVITAYYDDDTSKEVTGYTWSPAGALTQTDTVVTISYTENGITKTAEQEINIRKKAPAVSGIAIVSPPEKTSYVAGEVFNPAGMKVSEKYDDGTNGADVTSLITYSPSGSLATTDTEITVAYVAGSEKFETAQAITVAEGNATVKFGGGTYRGMHRIVLDIDNPQGDGYRLSENNAMKQWTYNGQYADSPFGRVQCNKADATVTFSMDFSGLADVSKVGFSANMIGTRAKTLVQVSTDNENFVTIGYADETDSGAMGKDLVSAYQSDYSENVRSLRGREVGDNHLYAYYWSLGEYMTDGKVVYVRFGYTDEYENVLESQSSGADIIDHANFYDELEIKRHGPLDRIEITNPPDKTVYKAGEFFGNTGMVVTAYYEGEEEGVEIEGYTFSPSAALSESDTAIVVAYEEKGVTKTVSLDIAVSKTPEGEVVFGGGSYTCEHKIVLGQDTDLYACENNTISSWSGLTGTSRFKTTAENQSVTFTFDFSDLSDRSSVGCSLNLVRRRARTVISASADGTQWTVIGHSVDESGKPTISSGYNEHVTELFGTEIKDENLYRFYYELGDFVGENGIVYVRCGYSSEYNSAGDGSIGADIIGYASGYDALTFNAAT